MKYDKNCILCKYKNSKDECSDMVLNHDDYECPTLSNIFYGKVVKLPIIKQIYSITTNYKYSKLNKYYENMDKKYGDCALEDDDYKFIWGVKSWDDLSGSNCNMMTMNDIDIIYDKKTKTYLLGIETAYIFDNVIGECKYLSNCLNAFTQYMDNNDLNKNENYMLFMSNPCIDMSSETIEQLYTNFNIFVKGYCIINGYDINNK